MRVDLKKRNLLVKTQINNQQTATEEEMNNTTW
jgi:hypothetical protein